MRLPRTNQFHALSSGFPLGLLCALAIVLSSCSNGSSPGPTIPPGSDDAEVEITSVAPSAGPATGGSAVTVSGTGFLQDVTGVLFGGRAANAVTVIDANTISCSTPANSVGSASVVVTTATEAVTLHAGFTFVDPLRVDSVAPLSGELGGGTVITLSGAGFGGGVDGIEIGGSPALDILVLDEGTVTCRTPAGSVGAADIVVTTPVESITVAAGFRYAVPPTLLSVQPVVGPASGGSLTTLNGSGFDEGVALVEFGDAAATVITVLNDTTLTCVTPASATGVVDVKLTTPGGTVSVPSAFTFVAALALVAVAPTAGPTAGGVQVTLTGVGFDAGLTQVSFGGVAAAQVMLLDDMTATCVLPAGSVGVVDVALASANQTATLPSGFSYLPVPTLNSIDVAAGPTSGGTPVVLTGTGFSNGVDSILFAGVLATDISVTSDTTAVCTTPSGALGLADIELITAGGEALLAAGFEYEPELVVTSVDPSTGPAAGGTQVTLTGESFSGVGATNVVVGGFAATNVDVIDAFSLTCSVPSGVVGPADVTVARGVQSATLPNGFTYVAPPSLTDVAPLNGPAGGGTVITLTGSGFTVGGASVRIGGSPATNVNVQSATSLTCTTPAGLPGVVDVAVTTIGGQATFPNGYTYIGAPTLSNVTPASGPAIGGTSIALTGSGFSMGLISVTVGGVPAANVALVGDTSITCDTPPGAVGIAAVSVTTIGGVAQLGSGFEYLAAPTLVSVSPDVGPVAGGTGLAITGSGFSVGTPSVVIGQAFATAINVIDDNTLLCDSPPGPAGPAAVTVSTAAGSAGLAAGFVYVPQPSLLGVLPATGATAGGLTVTLNGTGFASGIDAVRFGPNAATAVSVLNDTTATCVTPIGAVGSVDISVDTPGGTAVLPAAFDYVPDLVLTGVDPDGGPSSGGTVVTLTGGGFSVGLISVRFGALPATAVTALSDSLATCVTPAAGAGSVDVSVATATGNTSLSNGYTFADAPTISAVLPVSGSVNGGEQLVIDGSNFDAPLIEVFVGGAAATGVSVSSPTQLTCVTPVGSVGPAEVRVTTSGGTAALPSGYLYVAVPTLTGIAPDLGPLAGGTAVTLTGTGFVAGGTLVTFGGTPAANVVVTSTTQASCSTPAGSAGNAPVELTTVGGTTTLPGGFDYVPPPTLTSLAPSSGSTQGGTIVDLTGSGFAAGVASIKFAGVSATAIVVNSATSVRCTSPAGVAGVVDVELTTPGGSTTLQGGYEYVAPPTLTSVTPDVGPIAGGTTVTLNGTGFSAGGTVVQIGSVVVASVNVVNDSTITCDTPAGTLGVADVLVSTAGGMALLSGGFRYVPDLAILAVAPDAGAPAGGQVVTITGAGLSAGLNAVRFGGVAATVLSVAGDSDLICTTPANPAGIVDVSLESGTQVATLTGGYEYRDVPTLTALTPDFGPALGATPVTLTGSGFASGVTSVSFGGAQASSVVVASDTNLTCVTPLTGPGFVDVEVTTAAGSASLQGAFFFVNDECNAPRQIAGVGSFGFDLSYATTGAVGQTEALCVVQGSPAITNDMWFDWTAPSAGIATVELCGGTSVDTKLAAYDSLNCPIPQSALACNDDFCGLQSALSFSVNPGASYLLQVGTSPGAPPGDAAFTISIDLPPPTIAEITPGSGFIGGGNVVELHGTGFVDFGAGTNTVNFGGVVAPSVVVESDAVLRVTVPPGLAGAAAIDLANANGSALLEPGYSYYSDPLTVLAGNERLAAAQPGTANAGPPVLCASGDSVYAVYASDLNGLPDVFVDRSRNRGSTWLATSAAQTPVNTNPAGASNSINPHIASSADNVYVVWQDDRVGAFSDIYFNRSIDGGETWLANDIRINTDPAGTAQSSSPRVCCIGSKVYVVWQDARSDQGDIYFNASDDGGVTWGAVDVRIDDDPAAATASVPRIQVTSSALHVAWQDDRFSFPADIFYARSVNGGVSFAADERLSLNPLGNTQMGDLQVDGDNVCVVWTGGDGTGFGDILCNGSQDGGVTWLPAAVRVESTPQGIGDSRAPVLAVSGPNAFVAWMEDRFGVFDIYFRASDTVGASWLGLDRQLDTTPANTESFDPAICTAGNDIWVAWQDNRAAAPAFKFDIYMNRSQDSGATWLFADRRMNYTAPAGTNNATRPCVVAANGELAVAWRDERNGATDIYFEQRDLRVDRGAAGAAESRAARVATDGSEAFIVWEDNRGGDLDIYFNSTTQNGALVNMSDQQIDSDPGTNFASREPQITFGADTLGIVWTDERSGGGSGSDIYFRRSVDHGASFGPELRINTNAAGQLQLGEPRVAQSGPALYVAWRRDNSGAGSLYFNNSPDAGATWPFADRRIDDGSANVVGAARFLADGASVYAGWQDMRGGTTNAYFNRSLDGGVNWLPLDVRIDHAPAGTDAVQLQIASAGLNVFAVWSDARNGNEDIWFNRSTDGGATWQPVDVRLDDPAAGPWESRTPQIACDGDDVWIVWHERRFVDGEIFFNRSSDGGQTWLPSDLRIDNAPSSTGIGSRGLPQLIATGGNLFVVWRDVRSAPSANYDIYLNYSADRGASWAAADTRLDTDVEQFASSDVPQLAGVGARVFVVWEEERDGERDIRMNRSLEGEQ